MLLLSHMSVWFCGQAVSRDKIKAFYYCFHKTYKHQTWYRGWHGVKGFRRTKSLWSHDVSWQITNVLSPLPHRVPVKALSFVIDESFLSFDKSGFLTSKQKWRTIRTKTGIHYIFIRKWRNIFKKLTGTLPQDLLLTNLAEWPLKGNGLSH